LYGTWPYPAYSPVYLPPSPGYFGVSGIMTFQVNQDGVVYQKDLGPETPSLASAITRSDPDLSWARVDLAQP